MQCVISCAISAMSMFNIVGIDSTVLRVKIVTVHMISVMTVLVVFVLALVRCHI